MLILPAPAAAPAPPRCEACPSFDRVQMVTLVRPPWMPTEIELCAHCRTVAASQGYEVQLPEGALS